MYTYNIDWRFAYIPGISNGHVIAYATARKHSASVLRHVSALLIDNVLLAFSAHLCWPRKTFQVYCIVHLKLITSVYYCVSVKQWVGLLLVTHSCPVCDTCHSQTASKILSSATNKHKSMSNFLPPLMLSLHYRVLHESYLYCCIVHRWQTLMDLAIDSCHFISLYSTYCEISLNKNSVT